MNLSITLSGLRYPSASRTSSIRLNRSWRLSRGHLLKDGINVARGRHQRPHSASPIGAPASSLPTFHRAKCQRHKCRWQALGRLFVETFLRGPCIPMSHTQHRHAYIVPLRICQPSETKSDNITLPFRPTECFQALSRDESSPLHVRLSSRERFEINSGQLIQGASGPRSINWRRFPPRQSHHNIWLIAVGVLVQYGYDERTQYTACRRIISSMSANGLWLRPSM